MTDPQPFQGFTARRASQGPSDQPTTPIRRAVPSFALGSTDSTADPSRPTSPLQPIPMRYSPNNPFTQSTSLYRTPTQGPLRPGSAPVSPSLGLPPSASAGPTGPAPVGPTVPPPTSAPAASNPQTGPDLASAIALLAQTLQQPASAPTKSTNERHNVREPDPFDGSDPTKLRTFFAQLELVFKARPRTFDTDEKKVTYAVSHLKGITLAWFEPFLLEPASGNPPLFLSDYGVFQEELRANFGPYDVVGTAEHDLENLTMSDSHRVARYVTQFNRLATQVSWGSEALRYQFYKGLPDRLKDRISEIGKPKDLNKLRELAQSINARYWERKAERNREGRTPSAGNKSSSAPKPLLQVTLRRSLVAPPPRPHLRTPPSRGVRRLRATLRSPMPTSWARMASSRRRSVSAASQTTSVCSAEVPDIMWTPVPRSPPPPKLAPPRPRGPPPYRRSLRRARSQKTR